MSLSDWLFRPRREVRRALATNKMSEARLWARVAREETPGPRRDEALQKSLEREREARRLQEEFLRVASSVFGERRD